MLDEVFGTKAHQSTLVWQKRTSRDNRAAFSAAHDYIMIYAPAGTAWKNFRNRLPDGGGYVNPDADPLGPWRSIPMSVQAGHATKSQFYTITTPTGVRHDPPANRAWNYSEERFKELCAEGRVYWPKNGAGKPRLKKYPWESEGLVPFTLWPASEVGENSTAKTELMDLFPGVQPFSTPKPEALLKRIIEVATDPGDIVLDCYAGSGTTAAVAQKLGRRWLTSEWSSETLAAFTFPRLRSVVEGTDPGGVTSIEVPDEEALPDGIAASDARVAAKVIRTVRDLGEFDDIDGSALDEILEGIRRLGRTHRDVVWSGGGGFRVLDVGPSMFQEVDGRVYLADWATESALSEATAAQLGYEYAVDAPFCGSKGRTRLAVVDGLISEAVVRLLIDALPGPMLLCVCGTAVDPAARDVLRVLRPGSTIKKVPSALLDEYRMSRRERSRLAALLAATAETNEGGK